MGIVEFLEARIAEDEAFAAQAQGEHYGWIDYWTAETRRGTSTESVIYAHAFKFDPERVLAECAAKRAIMRDHAEMVEAIEYLSAALPGDLNQDPSALWRTAPYRHLAAVYQDHPEYNQEWTP